MSIINYQIEKYIKINLKKIIDISATLYFRVS